MKLKVNSFTDELRFKVVHEHMSSDLSQREFMEKYKIQGVKSIRIKGKRLQEE
jgi:Trp operon repressor